MRGINIKKNNDEYIKNAKLYVISIFSLLTQRYAILNGPANSELIWLTMTFRYDLTTQKINI